MQYYEALDYLSAALYLLFGILIDLLVLMNPSLGELLIGAVQACLDFVVADFNCLQQCRRKQQCHGVFAWFDRLSNMPLKVLQPLLNMFLYAGV